MWARSADLAKAWGRDLADLADKTGRRLAGDEATPGDVRAAFRLLFGREPDPAGLAYFQARLGPDYGTRDLARELMSSEEFFRTNADLVRPTAPLLALVDGAGFKIFVDERDWAVGGQVARTGSYEPAETATVVSLLEAGGGFVDVGANIGWFSLAAAHAVGADGSVLALEPNPANCELLERSVAENGFGTVRVVGVAVSRDIGVVGVHTNASNGSIFDVAGVARSMPCSFVAPAQPLDHLVDEAGMTRVDVIKIDVEGAEPLVLAGAGRTISRFRPHIVAEFSPGLLGEAPAYTRALALLARFRELGYGLSVIGTPGEPSDGDILAMVVDDPTTDHVNLLATPS